MKKCEVLKCFAIVLIMAILFNVFPVAAANFTKQLTAMYRDVKIFVDGEQFTPMDINGNLIEPFIVDGTTYLPIRAISEALGKSVNWVDETNSIYIGETKTTSIYDYVPVTGFDGLTGVSMAVGGTYVLPVTVLPKNATYKEIAFSSSNPDIVSVDKNGLLTSLDFGCSLITVTADGISSSIYVYSGDSLLRLFESNKLILKKGDIFDLNNTFSTNPESKRDKIIWNAYDLTEATTQSGYYTTHDSTKVIVENGTVTCLEPGFVVVCGKLVFENTAGAYALMEWVFTIEE